MPNVFTQFTITSFSRAPTGFLFDRRSSEFSNRYQPLSMQCHHDHVTNLQPSVRKHDHVAIRALDETVVSTVAGLLHTVLILIYRSDLSGTKGVGKVIPHRCSAECSCCGRIRPQRSSFVRSNSWRYLSRRFSKARSPSQKRKVIPVTIIRRMLLSSCVLNCVIVRL